MRIYQQNSTCVRTTVKGEAMMFAYPVSAYVFCLYVYLCIFWKCPVQTVKLPEPSRNQQVTCRFEKVTNIRNEELNTHLRGDIFQFYPGVPDGCDIFLRRFKFLLQQMVQIPSITGLCEITRPLLHAPKICAEMPGSRSFDAHFAEWGKVWGMVQRWTVKGLGELLELS